MKKIIFTLTILSTLLSQAFAIETKDVNFDCDGNPSADIGYFRARQLKYNYLAKIGDKHPLLVGSSTGEAKIEKLKGSNYKITTDLLIINPWAVTDYWDKLIVSMNLKESTISYRLVSGYTDETILEDSKTCNILILGDALEKAIKAL